MASVLGFFQPHIYETAGGISNEQANWMNCIQWAIIVFVTFLLSKVIDRTGHKLIYVLGLLFALSAWVIIVTVGVNGTAGLWLGTISIGISTNSTARCWWG